MPTMALCKRWQFISPPIEVGEFLLILVKHYSRYLLTFHACPFSMKIGFFITRIKKYSNIGRNTDMKTVKISLNSIDKVKSFVNDLTKFDTDFDLVSGRYVIDAKSIMGIFSLDLSKPIDLNIHADGAALDSVMEIIDKYTVE